MGAVLSKELIGVKESVYDGMLLLNQYQIPILKRIGFGQPVYNTKHEWVEDRMLSDKTLINGSITDSATSVVVDDATPFRANQVVEIEEEWLLVTAVNVGTKTLTVSRAFGGTTAAAHADNKEIQVMFNNSPEGSDANEARYKPRANIDNYTQIFDETISISGSSEAVAQYGVENEYMKERAKAEERLMYELEKSIVSGKKFNDPSTNRRVSGGMRQFIQSNVIDAGAAQLTMELINHALRGIYDAGGMKEVTDHIVLVSSVQRQYITNILKDFVRINRTDTTTGFTYDAIVTDYGELPIVLDNNLKADEIIIPDCNRMAVRPLGDRGFFHTYMGKKGDYTEGQIIGEYTLEFKQEQAHARIHNLKISG